MRPGTRQRPFTLDIVAVNVDDTLAKQALKNCMQKTVSKEIFFQQKYYYKL